MNRVVLSASIAERSALRYTPAGVPALDLRLDHESQAEEAGVRRQVRLAIRAKALGGVAEVLVRQAVGTSGSFSGFLASARPGAHPVLHIQEFRTESTQEP